MNKFRGAVARATIFAIAAALFFFIAAEPSCAAAEEVTLCDATYMPRTSRYEPSTGYKRHATASGATEEGGDELRGGIIDYTGIDGAFGSFSSVVPEGTGSAANAYAKYEVASDKEENGTKAPFLDILHAGGGSYDVGESNSGFVPIAAERPMIEYGYIVEEVDIATESSYVPLEAQLVLSGFAPSYDGNAQFEGIEKVTLSSAKPVFRISADGKLHAGEGSVDLPADGSFTRVTIIVETKAKKTDYLINEESVAFWGSDEIKRGGYDLSGTSVHVYANDEWLGSVSGLIASNVVIDREFSSSFGVDALRLNVDAEARENAVGSSICLDNFYLGHYKPNDAESIAEILAEPTGSLAGKSGVLNWPESPAVGAGRFAEAPSGIMLNLGVHTYFELNFYIPMGEGREIEGLYLDESLTRAAEYDGAVKIDGALYEKYHVAFGVAETEIREYYLAYRENGEERISRLEYGIPYYAAAVMGDAEQGEEARRLIMSMVNYQDKVMRLLGQESGASVYAKLLATYAQYIESYDDAEFMEGGDIYRDEVAVLDRSDSAIEEYIHGVRFYFSKYEPTFAVEYSAAALIHGLAKPNGANGELDEGAEGLRLEARFGGEDGVSVLGKHIACGADGNALDWESALTTEGAIFYAFTFNDANVAPSVCTLNGIVELTLLDGGEELGSATYSLAAYINAMLTQGERAAADAAIALYAYSSACENFAMICRWRKSLSFASAKNGVCNGAI